MLELKKRIRESEEKPGGEK